MLFKAKSGAGVGSRQGLRGFGAARLASKIFFALRGLSSAYPYIYCLGLLSAANETEQRFEPAPPNQYGELCDLGRF